MTEGTILGCTFKIGEGVSIDMATLAGNRKVFADQFECKLVMRKVPTQAVNAVVTIETCRAVRFDVARHERRVTQTMTGRADVQVEDSDIRGVTIRANKRFLLSLELVRGQHISRQLVRILPPIQHGEQRCGSIMFGVTVPALRGGINPIHPPMLGEHIAHLRRDVRMADHTAVIHGVGSPGRDMTRATFPGNLGMGRDAAQHWSLNGIQRAGTEHRPTAREGISRDDKSRDQRGDYACPRETTQACSSHALLLTDKVTSKRWRNTAPLQYAQKRI